MSLRPRPQERKSPEFLDSLIRKALSLELKKNDPEKIAALQVSLAYALLNQRKPGEARELVRTVLAARPGYGEAIWCEALLSLYLDPWPAAWAGLEARSLAKWNRQVPPGKTWDGSALNGRPILLAAEGLFGDQIQYVRFAATLKAAGAGHVTVSALPALIPLFKDVAGVDSVVPCDPTANQFNQYGRYDLGVPMLSVLFLLGTTLETLPNQPYLSAPADRIADARSRIAERRGTLNVGLCWRSTSGFRCRPLELFRPLLDVRGIQLFGIGERAEIAEEISNFPSFPIVNAGAEDFPATAAILSALDLIITVDTVTAHLAGALGRPTWTLLEEVPDWKWGLDGEITPWYPSMRLFRQEQRSWTKPIQRIVDALARFALDSISGGKIPEAPHRDSVLPHHSSHLGL